MPDADPDLAARRVADADPDLAARRVADADLDELAAEASTCTRCELAGTRTHVVFASGAAPAGLMVVGEAPGRDEDLQGKPFVGRSGQLLDRLLIEAGLDRPEVYVANVVKCRPPGNRDPKPVEIEACRPYLEAQLAAVRPAVVVTLGNFATRTLLGTREGITALRGRCHPWGEGRVVVPTFHPAAAMRGGAKVMAMVREDFATASRVLAGVGR